MSNNTVREQILSLTNQGLDVFNYYLPSLQLPSRKNFRSPFYEDKKASCNIYKTRWGIWCFKDFGDGGNDFGDCFWFVGRLVGLSSERDFPEIMTKIISDMSLPVAHNNIPATSPQYPKQIKQTPVHSCNTSPSRVKCDYKTKPFTTAELSYWERYGITESILKRYNVKSLSSYHATRASDGKEYTLYASECDPMYLYDLGSAVKIYRPFNTIRFLQAGVKSDRTIFGFDNLPMRGDVVIITGGEKDVMSFYAKGYHAVCFNSETSSIGEEVMDMLSRRFKHIIICYDTDDTGRKASQSIVEQYKDKEVLRLELPLSGEKTSKDISDYFAEGNSRQDFAGLLMELLEQKLYNHTIMLLKSCEIDTKHPPISSNSIITIQDTTLGAYDNLLCITGGEGTGKSNFVASLLAGTISNRQLSDETTLGIRVERNEHKLAVLHYDTEQSDAQLYKNVQRAYQRAGLDDKPDFYHAVCITCLSRKERLQLIQDSMDMYYHKHGGIHLVVIDGVADLIRSANDEIESVAIVEELYRLAGIYHTCIICVLHFVPNSTKLRGHIGSELQRKSAGIISVEKDKQDPSRSLVNVLKVRDGDPLDIPTLMLSWDKVSNMQVFAGTNSYEDREQRKYEELKALADKLLEKSGVMSREKFLEELHRSLGVKDERTSKRRFEYMQAHQIIELDADGDNVRMAI